MYTLFVCVTVSHRNRPQREVQTMSARHKFKSTPTLDIYIFIRHYSKEGMRMGIVII